jgi:hypothetical protein
MCSFKLVPFKFFNISKIFVAKYNLIRTHSDTGPEHFESLV